MWLGGSDLFCLTVYKGLDLKAVYVTPRSQ